MRVLVCGGRAYNRGDLVDRRLDQLHKAQEITVLIHGGADGVDTLAGEWAERNGVRMVMCLILAGEGGFKRNRRMLVEGRPDLVVHFPGRRGTRDMVERATRAAVATMGGLSTPPEDNNDNRQEELI